MCIEHDGSMSLLEPDVALTDLIVAGECSLFSTLLWQSDAKRDSLRWWFVLFFAATGTAALLGAAVHGFIADAASAEYRILWVLIFGAIGGAGVASWAIGTHLALSAAAAKWIITAVAGSFLLYLLVVIFVSQSFAVAVFYYVPAAVFLLVALIIAQLRGEYKSSKLALVGVLLTFVAAYIQQAEASLISLHLSYNALYHVVQAIALLLIFLGARHLIEPIARVKQ